jgi:hypothetical protein
MSGPFAETGPLYVRTSAGVHLWPLEMWADGGEAHVECGECRSGELLVAKTRGRAFVLADLTARLEEHIARCPGARDRS